MTRSIPVSAYLYTAFGAAIERVIGLALGTEDLSASVGLAALPHTLYGPAQQLVCAASRQSCIPYGFPRGFRHSPSAGSGHERPFLIDSRGQPRMGAG